MFEFQEASPQIEATIAEEVRVFALERIAHVFESALRDGLDALQASSTGHDHSEQTCHRPTAANADAPGLSAGPPGPGGIMERPEMRGWRDEQASNGDAPVRHRGPLSVASCHGTVSLAIEHGGDPIRVVSFIDALRQTRRVLVSQLIGGSIGDTHILLRLPAPIGLEDMLLSMEEVSHVESRSQGSHADLTVHLTASTSRALTRGNRSLKSMTDGVGTSRARG